MHAYGSDRRFMPPETRTPRCGGFVFHVQHSGTVHASGSCPMHWKLARRERLHICGNSWSNTPRGPADQRLHICTALTRFGARRLAQGRAVRFTGPVWSSKWGLNQSSKYSQNNVYTVEQMWYIKNSTFWTNLYLNNIILLVFFEIKSSIICS